MQNAIVIEIIELLLKYGPGIVHRISDLMTDGAASLEDLRSLKIGKEPESYFDNQNKTDTTL